MTTVRKLNGHKPIPSILTVLALLLLLSGFLTTGIQVVIAAAAQQPFVATANAPAFADPAFQKLWNRTDQQVASGAASRTFLWGPAPNTQGIVEDYQESPNGGKRLVQYFDKSRMEITYPGGDQTSQYYVSNGLLAKELMTGQMQLGDNKFETHDAASIGVAGDQDDTTGPTYAALERTDKPAATDDTGILVGATIDRAGNTSFDNPGDLGKKWQVSNAFYESATKHNIAGPFWTFLNQTGPVQNAQGSAATTGRLFDPVYYATGLPITEAYWAQVKVAGVTKDVLVQAFERRVLTFTPTNSPAFQVEMGNVGQHYYRWRYTTNNVQPVYAPASPPVTSTPLPPAPTPTPKPGGGNLPAANCLPATVNVTGNLVQACVSNASPTHNTNVTVYGRLVVGGQPVSGATMDTTWHYKSKPSYCGGEAATGADGIASCTRDVSSATSGYQVVIDMVFSYGGQTYNGQTSFTPQ